MKIKEDSPTAVSMTQLVAMENNRSYRSYNKTSELIDVCMDAMREEGKEPCKSTELPMLRRRCTGSTDRSLASTVEEFDAEEMQPFYSQSERKTDTDRRENYAAEMLSPIGASNFDIDAVSSPIGWSSETGFEQEMASTHGHMVVEENRFSMHEAFQSSRDIGQDFWPSDTKSRALNRERQEKTDMRICGTNFPTNDDRQRENTSRFPTLGEASDAYESFRQTHKNNNKGLDFESASESRTTSTSVMREIDIAVSLAQSRFMDADVGSTQSVFSSSNNANSTGQRDIRSEFSKLTRKQTRHSSDDSLSMTKDYASHNMSACLIEDEWKRKSEYGSTVPAVHDLTTSFEQSRCRRASGFGTVGAFETRSAPGIVSDSNYSNAEPAPSESAPSKESRLSTDTKINLNRDEENSTSYAVGESLLHSQSSAPKACWSQKEKYQKQNLERVSKHFDSSIPYYKEFKTNETQNKPVNLCLHQKKYRDCDLGHKSSTGKVSTYRKYTKSFVAKKPYQHSKRRSRSQCLVDHVSPEGLSVCEPSYADGRIGSSRQVIGCDMGVDNRAASENYNEPTSTLSRNQVNITDSNLLPLFSSHEASHMMVQDEAKTYAILSGRQGEEMMNPHSLSSSGSPHQQQSIYQQPRPSHSIINYVGPHGQSSDLRTDMNSSSPVRDHRATPSSSLPGMLPNSKIFSNVMRQYESSSNPFDSLHQPHSLMQNNHAGTSTFSPLHISQQQHHSQQVSPYMPRHHQKKEYYDNISSHSGLANTGTMYGGSLQLQHQGYLKPPPVDLDDLSDEERERMRVKRERNRVAAAKCRNRRRELLERLEKEAEQLEREQELLRESVRRLRVQKLQLGNLLEDHEPSCQKVISEEITSGQSEDCQGAKDDDQPRSASSGGIETSESSASKNTSPSLQLKA